MAVLALGLYGLTIAYAGRTLSEAISAAFLLIGLEALDRPERGARDGFVAGCALGLSVVAWYPAAVAVLAALAWCLWTRRFHHLWGVCIAGSAISLGLGALDSWTWKSPFHSLYAYLDYNVISDRAAQDLGARPAMFYLPYVLGWLPVWAWVGLPFALRLERAVPLPLLCALVELIALSLTPRKEVCFLYPALVLVALGAAPGLWVALQKVRRPVFRVSVACLALCVGLAPCFFQRDVRGDQFHAIVRASRGEDATGLLLVNEGLWGAGGYFYIGKNIPWWTCDSPEDDSFRAAMADRRINRVVVFEGKGFVALERNGFRVVDQIGRATILVRP